MSAVLEQEQEVDGRVVKRVIVSTWKTLKYSQQWYCTTNTKLLAVVTAVELFKYYLMGRYFTVVTDHGSLMWFRNPLLNDVGTCYRVSGGSNRGG